MFSIVHTSEGWVVEFDYGVIRERSTETFTSALNASAWANSLLSEKERDEAMDQLDRDDQPIVPRTVAQLLA